MPLGVMETWQTTRASPFEDEDVIKARRAQQRVEQAKWRGNSKRDGRVKGTLLARSGNRRPHDLLLNQINFLDNYYHTLISESFWQLLPICSLLWVTFYDGLRARDDYNTKAVLRSCLLGNAT
jgi:hypothetical protein